MIPGLGTRHSKCTGAKVRDRGGDNEVPTSSGSESLSATDGCDWSTEVGDVRRCQSILVRQQTQLELHGTGRAAGRETSGGDLATRA